MGTGAEGAQAAKGAAGKDRVVDDSMGVGGEGIQNRDGILTGSGNRFGRGCEGGSYGRTRLMCR